VHATHATPGEIDAVAAGRCGRRAVPGTEGNLGDGLCDLPGWLGPACRWRIGSDSHVTRNWPEELRWLEYGQRLLRRQRNVAACWWWTRKRTRCAACLPTTCWTAWCLQHPRGPLRA
jgi:formimidoylglutamate deiminase